MKTFLLTAAVLIVAVLLLFGFSGPSSLEGSGSTFVFARGKDSVKLDPADITDGESAKVCVNVYDTLVQYAPETTDIEPALAESWETSEDGTVWTFRLRPGVTFHDGTPCDAEAVVFSFRRQMDPEHPAHTGKFIYWGSLFSDVEKIEAVDSRTVRFTLGRPYAPFLSNLAVFAAAIVPPSSFDGNGSSLEEHPVGTGPFRFLAWERDQRIVLEANEEYWNGPPAIDRLILRVIPDNGTRFLSLVNGDVHAMDGLNPQDLSAAESDPNAVVLRKPGNNVAYFAMNQMKPVFQDVRVRRAVAHAVDKEAIAKHLYYGTAVPATLPLPPTSWGYHDGIEDYEFDLEKARGLLKEADVEPGTELELWIFTNPRPYMPDPQKMAVHLKSNLEKIGFDVTIVTHDWAAHLEKTQNGEHPMCLLGWNGDNGDPDNFLYFLLDKENAKVGSALNVSFYRSDELHDILARAQSELDFETRKTLYRRAQEIIHRDCPMVPLVHNAQILVTRPNVSGLHVHPAVNVRFHTVELK